MKILFIIGTISGGGAEKVVSIISSALVENHDVTVFLDERTDNEYVISDKVRIECVAGIKKGVLNKVHALRVLKRRENYDVAISFSIQSALCNLCSHQGEKLVVSVRATTSGTTSKFHGQILKWCCKHADNVVSVSDCCGKDLVLNYGVDEKKVITIYNPFDARLLRTATTGELTLEQKLFLANGNGKILLSTHGRLSSEKGHCHLIRAMKSVVARYPEAYLYIMGDGPLEEALKTLIWDMGLQDNVFLFGHTMNPFVVLKETDIYVFSSSCEGFPNAVLDAMACGLPVVSSDCHGVHELLSPDTDCNAQTESINYALDGVLSKRFDDRWLDASTPITYEEECFANAVCQLLENKALRENYSARSQERIRNFAIDKIVAQWEKVLA